MMKTQGAKHEERHALFEEYQRLAQVFDSILDERWAASHRRQLQEQVQRIEAAALKLESSGRLGADTDEQNRIFGLKQTYLRLTTDHLREHVTAILDAAVERGITFTKGERSP